MANCTTCRSALWVVENAILMRYYWHTADTRAIEDSINQLADNQTNLDGLEVYFQTVSELTVWVD
jgi:hypothetical protein